MKRTIQILIIGVCSFIIIILVWLTITGETAYLYALHLESKWSPAHPKTKAELEQYLNFYSLHQIQPKDSMWGHEYQLQAGERMMQYRILWHKNCPLDVVYDQEDNIKAIFTSYE